MSVRYTILGLLQYKDMHGYRIKELIESDFGHMWSINHGQIYQTLRKLEEEGLVALVKVSPSVNGGPHKKSYSITQAGREEFARWLATSPEKQMILRDPFLTRFVFFDFGDREDALRIIDEQIALYEEQLRAREKHMPRRSRQGVYVRLISELGANFNEMFLEWLKQAREEVANDRQKSGRAADRVLPDGIE
jgi:PadR family transcriptional regulator, phenolic acid-responsive transcriptional regulator